MLGWLYVAGALASLPPALRLGLSSSCALCVTPFVIWSVVTLVVTAIGASLAILRSYSSHRDFMLRSYALLYGFVLVRLDLWLQGTFLEVPLPPGVPRESMVLWMAWVLPLLLCECGLSWGPALHRAVAGRNRRGT